MLAVLTDEQAALEELVQSMASTVGITQPGDLTQFDHEKAWQTIAGADLLSLRVRHNGVPLASGVEAQVVAQQLGSVLSPVPFIAGTLAVEILEAAGAPANLVESAASGAEQFAIILRHDLSGPAEASVLSGAIAVAGARSTRGLALRGNQLVSVDLAGFDPREGTDLTARLLAAPAGSGSATTDIGREIPDEALTRWFALGLTLLAADSAGTAHAALAGVIEYAKSRIAYGRPIGTYQALQHMAADAFAACEGMVTAANYAAWAIDALPAPEALLAARTAKAWAASVALDVTETVMQMYGGIGQTWEHLAHVHTRRVLSNNALFGNELYQLDRITELRKQVA
jgi:hypothetical protein